MNDRKLHEEIMINIEELQEYLGSLMGRLSDDTEQTMKYVRRYNPTIKRWMDQAFKMWMAMEK